MHVRKSSALTLLYGGSDGPARQQPRLQPAGKANQIPGPETGGQGEQRHYRTCTGTYVRACAHNVGRADEHLQ